MGEPSSTTLHLLRDESAPRELSLLVQHKFPGSQLLKNEDGTHSLVTVHSSGPTEEHALRNAIKDYNDMCEDGKSLRTMLDDVIEDLRTPGMNRERHDSLIEILTLAEASLNAGILTNTVPWILIPSYNRQIEELKRRVDTRLNMMAADLNARELAKKRAGEAAPPRPKIPEGMSQYRWLQSQVKR